MKVLNNHQTITTITPLHEGSQQPSNENQLKKHEALLI
jgi:hypothetical protein